MYLSVCLRVAVLLNDQFLFLLRRRRRYIPMFVSVFRSPVYFALETLVQS